MARWINFFKYFFYVIRCCWGAVHDHAKLAKEDDYGEGNFGLHLFFISFLSFKTDGYCVDYFVCFDFLTTCLQNKAFARHRLLLPITKYSSCIC